MLKNKLNITNQIDLEKAEEKISKQKVLVVNKVVISGIEIEVSFFTSITFLTLKVRFMVVNFHL